MRPYLLKENEFLALDNLKTVGEQNVKSGSLLLFTRTSQERLDPDKYQPEGRPRRSEQGFQHPPIGSPTNKPQTLPSLNTKTGIPMQSGFNKNNPTKRLPSLSDSATGLKRQTSKSGTPKLKELDENGNPIKKLRSKRTNKDVTEATIFYRLVQKDKEADLKEAGYPSPEASEKGDDDGEDPNEEKKGENGENNTE